MAFKEYIGAIFVQVRNAFTPKRKQELFTYLQSLPTDLQFFLEVLHPGWFTIQAVQEGLMQFLHTNNMGIVITDNVGRREYCHMHLTVPKAFIRYVGNSLHASNYTPVHTCIERMKH